MINFVVGYEQNDETFMFIDYSKMEMTESFNTFIEGKEIIEDVSILEERLKESEELCHIYYIPKDGKYNPKYSKDVIPKELFQYIHENFNQNPSKSTVERNDRESVVYLCYKRKRGR